MDERDNILETLQDSGIKDDNDIDSASDLKRTWSDVLANGSSKREIASQSSGKICEIPAQSTEKGGTDRDCLKTEDVPSRISEEGCNFEADVNFHPPVSRDPSKDCPSTISNHEEVLDISPSAFSLSTLDSFVEEEPHKILQVRKMYVFDNKFTVLPRSMSKLRNLKSLKIFSNEVRLLPDEIGDIAQLERFQLKVCPTSLGSMPPLGNLKCLKTLELHQTPLRPSVFSLPPDISKLHLLTRLAVCNFSISFLPPEIGDLKCLEELDISFNRLKMLPKEVSSLTALKHLRAENNKLVELPPGLGSLPNLSYIDVAHNKLTSLEPLGLSAMTSLRALDAKFNKLQNTFDIPVWITCNLEGNPSSAGQIASSSDDAVDSELLPSAAEGDEVSSPAPVSLHLKETVVQKNQVHDKNKRGWRRHDVHQLQARQDRLNMSRKSKAECREETQAEVDDVMVSGSSLPEERFKERQAVRLLDGGFHEELIADGSEANNDEKVQREGCARQDNTTAEVVEDSHGSRRSKKDVHSANTFPAFIEDSDYTLVKGGIVINSHSSRKVISGDRCNQRANKHSPDDTSIVDHERESGQTFIFKSKEELEHGVVYGRRKGGSSDRNPNPRKRRKSAQEFSEVSYMYRSESLCGFSDRLQDGFYDAGRDHPFSSLESLETEQPCFSSREVILVDRERDEELDVIAVSAQHFLTGMELAGRNVGYGSGLNAFQKAAILSLFVSDCFGGSDKSLNVTSTRRAALGGSCGAPFVCSCSSSSNFTSMSNLTESSDRFQGTVPTVHMLCEGSVRLLKMQRQSNVVPLGSLPYGVCRHRAILFKYLCDRASIPCELVRGYLDYVPHAWNVILVNKESDEVRMLVDACRPLDMREEKDSEYFCRYIPLRRYHLPSLNGRELSVVQSKDIIPLLHEEIGRGASGSVVRRCSLGTFTAAAKVRLFDQTNEQLYKDTESRCLSELRILCSLGEHPHIISFYGHQISSVPLTSVDAKQGSEAVQLMIFMDYFQGGSLENVLARYAKEGRMYMPAKEAAYVAKDVVHALSFIHSKGIIHRDIKSSNVLVDIGGNQGDSTISVKLCDFDSAVPLISSSSHTCYLAHRGVPSVEVCVGTPRWMAPEVFSAMYSRHPYGLEADIWSFGCLLLEMLTLAVPYAGLPEGQIQSSIQTGQRPQLPVEIENLVNEITSEGEQAQNKSSVSDEELKVLKVLVGLFKSCTESCPPSRPTALEMYKTLSMILESDSIVDGSTNISNTEVTKATPTSHSLEGSCLENSLTSLDAYEQHEDTQKRHDKKDVITFVEKAGKK